MMHDNNDQCWVKYLKWVKFNCNTSYHTTIRMTPFEAVYGRPPFFRLATLNVPKEHWGVINNEDDLNNFQQTSVADLIAASVDELSESSNLFDNEVPTYTEEYPNEPQSPYLSKFLPISDDYEFSISDRVPPGTIVDGIEYNSNFETPTSSIPVILENQIRALESDNLISEEQFSMRRLSNSSSIVSNINPTNSTNLLCAVCENETSGVHSCPECCRFVHVPCGIQQGEEGFGSSVWCQGCFLKERSTNTHHLRKGIKRNQETLHDRMLKSSGKKFKPAEIGDTVLIPISQPDKMNSIGPRNLMGHIIDAQDSVYTVATSHGTIFSGYARNQFDVCPFRISANESCHTSMVSQTEAMQSASLGLSGSACRCKHCKTLRCPCKKSGRSCNTKCHKGHTCFNKFA
ncbi:hypothetical protein LOD99_3874 [Oopsacas minuta]|uniref:SCAN domain-containing protein n=1 Tax=Oopsacas minuta TaxID=111878 RepID=A0AAV7JVJ6_9METZ|nr:hypothetical protein LOD99_3874 [Oopsacas minuta]